MNELEPLLLAPFAGAELPPQLRWHNEPKRWSLDARAGVLRVEPDAPTDFWQRTHYGFRADNGHFLYQEVLGDFILTVHARFRPVHQYDQAGLMVRMSPDCWLKSSVEFELDGPSRLGAVVTNYGYSDWSTQDFAPGAGATWLRIRREGDDYLVEASAAQQGWSQVRMAHLHEGHDAAAKCGVYACSPKGAGFAAEFDNLSIDAGRGN
jgi:regulation of enolase protein 1 (concanavalin A-like superfamily)